METHFPRTSGTTKGFIAVCKLKHFIVKEHQELFPYIKEQMKQNPRMATNIYTAFLACLPFQIKGKLTPELKEKILRTYRVI